MYAVVEVFTDFLCDHLNCLGIYMHKARDGLQYEIYFILFIIIEIHLPRW